MRPACSQISLHFTRQLGSSTLVFAQVRKASRKRAITALNDAEALPNPHIKHLFSDVFNAPMPWHLTEQMAELKDHLDKYRDDPLYKDIPNEEIDTMVPDGL